MMKTGFRIAVTSGALLFAVTAGAQTQGQQQNDVLGQLLGAVFGSNQQASEQTLESDWNQGRRPFAQRRDQLDARIDTAVRDGSLTTNEAAEMRREYDDIVRLEAQYSADGNVSQAQRNDLRTRYRALTQRVGNNQTGGNQIDGNQTDGRWQPLSMRNAAFEQDLSTGLRNRTLTQAEAARLRADWRSLAQLEASYQRGGIDAREQADLWARYNAIDARLGGGGFGNDLNPARWTQLETRLVAAERNGSISRNTAVQARTQMSDLARLDAAYSAGGYSADQRAYLTRRYAEMEAMIGDGRR